MYVADRINLSLIIISNNGKHSYIIDFSKSSEKLVNL